MRFLHLFLQLDQPFLGPFDEFLAIRDCSVRGFSRTATRALSKTATPPGLGNCAPCSWSLVHLTGAVRSRASLADSGFVCPEWTALVEALRPNQPGRDEVDPADHTHGWQFFAAQRWRSIGSAIWKDRAEDRGILVLGTIRMNSSGCNSSRCSTAFRLCRICSPRGSSSSSVQLPARPTISVSVALR